MILIWISAILAKAAQVKKLLRENYNATVYLNCKCRACELFTFSHQRQINSKRKALEHHALHLKSMSYLLWTTFNYFLFKLIIALGNRLACICFYQFFTCGFIEVTVLHAWYEIEELGEIALSHANGSHNLDSATVGMGGVVIQHRHWTNPSNHGRSHTTKTTWAKLICT